VVRPWFDAVLKHLDANVNIIWLAAEGEAVKKIRLYVKLSGSARGLLTGERTALNLLATFVRDGNSFQAVCGCGLLARVAKCWIPQNHIRG